MREASVNLSSPCDACGHPVGGGLQYCPNCKIALCFKCRAELMLMQKNPLAHARCLTCGEYFPN